MTPCDLSGLAQTVLGPVRPEELGPTMTHEHVLIDFTSILQPPEDPSNPGPAFEPVSMENLGWVSYNYFSNRDNLLLEDEETAIRELLLYKRAGGGTLVEASTIGLSRNPRGAEAYRQGLRGQHRDGRGLLRRRRASGRDGRAVGGRPGRPDSR